MKEFNLRLLQAIILLIDSLKYSETYTKELKQIVESMIENEK